MIQIVSKSYQRLRPEPANGCTNLAHSQVLQVAADEVESKRLQIQGLRAGHRFVSQGSQDNRQPEDADAAFAPVGASQKLTVTPRLGDIWHLFEPAGRLACCQLCSQLSSVQKACGLRSPRPVRRPLRSKRHVSVSEPANHVTK